MPAKFSAYLTIYNDWEFLEQALRSIASYVDELVVVDGAYEWMAPYLTAMGHDLRRSDQRVYDILQKCGIPYRVISEVWTSEIEKRMAGYRACTGRYICRIDSDEILFFDDKELQRFFRRGGAVGQVEMPTYIAPGWVKSRAPDPPARSRRAKLRAIFRKPRTPLKRYSFLFDRHRIDPEIHLNYLSIVLDIDKRPRAGETPFDIYPFPIGFGAHLTIWRSIPTSVYRAESYVLHYILRNGVPWLPQLRGKPLGDLNALFDIVPPQMFREIMQASRLSVGNMLTGEIFMAPTPLTPGQEAIFAGRYKDLLAGHATLNRRMCETGLHFAPEMAVVIDISDTACVNSIAPDGALRVEFESDVVSAAVELRTLIPHPPWQTVSPLKHRREGNVLVIDIASAEEPSLRREIEFKARTRSDRPVQRFKVKVAGQ